MSHETLNGSCPVPFLQETLFPSTGGYVKGRYCTSFPTSDGSVSCCVPCPVDTWRFDHVVRDSRIANWMGVAALPLPVFLLVTYAMLPVKCTNCTWFGFCVSLSCCLMEIAFVIPLGRTQNECYNEITPNDMHSDLACAFSGSLMTFGGCSVVVWVFVRTVGFHLQVCWEARLGQRFTWAAVMCGGLLIVVIVTLVLCLSGISYRFGETCIPNSRNSAWDFWIPLLFIAVVALLLQFVTVAYCMRVYLNSLDANSAALGPRRFSSSNGARTSYRRQAYDRVREILFLQWRGIGLIFVMIGHVIFVAVVFLLGNEYDKDIKDSKDAQAWVSCLVATDGDKKKCFPQAGRIGPGEDRVTAAICLLSLVGLWDIVLLARRSMLHGWLDLFKRLRFRRSDFVSVDSLTASQPYEITPKSATLMNSTELEVQTPSLARIDTARSPGLEDRYFAQEANYFQPSMSFSTPRPPKLSQVRDWDPEATFAPSFRHDCNSESRRTDQKT